MPVIRHCQTAYWFTRVNQHVQAGGAAAQLNAGRVGGVDGLGLRARLEGVKHGREGKGG